MTWMLEVTARQEIPWLIHHLWVFVIADLRGFMAPLTPGSQQLVQQFVSVPFWWLPLLPAGQRSFNGPVMCIIFFIWHVHFILMVIHSEATHNFDVSLFSIQDILSSNSIDTCQHSLKSRELLEQIIFFNLNNSCSLTLYKNKIMN